MTTKQSTLKDKKPEHNCLNREYCITYNQYKIANISPKLWQDICDIVGDDDHRKALRLEKRFGQEIVKVEAKERQRVLEEVRQLASNLMVNVNSDVDSRTMAYKAYIQRRGHNDALKLLIEKLNELEKEL